MTETDNFCDLYTIHVPVRYRKPMESLRGRTLFDLSAGTCIYTIAADYIGISVYREVDNGYYD